MKLHVKFIKYFWMLLLPALLFLSCSEEHAIGETADNAFVLTLNVPDINKAATKALSENDESKVTEADVLVFNRATQKFLYHARGLNRIEDAPGTPGVDRNIRFTVMLHEKPGIASYDLIVLANARETINDILGALTTDSSKDEVKELLKVALTPGVGWISTTTDVAYKAIPMWGEMTDKAISRTENYNVSLLRMLARIDLSVVLDPAKHSPTDEFNILQLKLYNYSKQGYLIPSPANMGVNAQGRPLAVAPSVPGGALAGGAANSIDYSNKIVNGSLVREIYTFESVAGSSLNYQNNICLVFQGEYIHDGVTETGWYRVDFANTTANLTADYVSIKRNHRYGVIITKVAGRGLATEEDAFGSRPINIENQIVEQNGGSFNDIVWNGQYYIKFDKKKVIFNQFGTPEAQVINIETNALDLKMSDFIDQSNGAGDGFWNEIATDLWSNNHFTVRLNKNIIGADGVLTATLTFSAIPMVSEDPLRTTEFLLKGANLILKLIIQQDIHGVYRLTGSPDPQYPITWDVTALGRIPINIGSSLPYLITYDSDDPYMIEGVYATSEGGVPLDLTNAIPQTIDTIWVELGGYPLPYTRLTSFNIQHQDPLSTAPPLHYNIIQSRFDFKINLLSGGFTQKLSKRGGTVDLEVTSNHSIWKPLMWIDNVRVPDANIGTYFNHVTGSYNMILKFTIGPLPGNNNRAIKIRVMDAVANAMSTQEVVINQMTFVGESVERISIEGRGEDAKLVITQNPNDGGLVFKYGSLVGIYNDHRDNTELPIKGDDPFHEGDVAFNPTNITSFRDGYFSIDVPCERDGNNINTTFHRNINNARMGKGDPCRLVGYTVRHVKAELAAGRVPDNGVWRLPTSSEYSSLIMGSSSAENCWWAGENSPFGNPAVSGIEVPSRNNGGDGHFFPLAQRRSENGWTVSPTVQNAMYWSATAINTRYSYAFLITPVNMELITFGGINGGFPIRCVRQ